MGFRRPVRYSPIGIRAETRTGCEIPKLALQICEPPRTKKKKRQADVSIGSQKIRMVQRPKALEL